MRRQTLEGCDQTAQYEIWGQLQDMGLTGERKEYKVMASKQAEGPKK
jgi:hypothetical protein